VGTAAASSPSAPGKTATGHFALAASAFAPDQIGNPADDYSNQWDPASLSNPASDRRFNAELTLPVSATLKSVRIYYTEGSASMYFEVNRQKLANHTFVKLVTGRTHTSGTPAYTSLTKNVPGSEAKVDMRQYAYSIGVCPD